MAQNVKDKEAYQRLNYLYQVGERRVLLSVADTLLTC